MTLKSKALRMAFLSFQGVRKLLDIKVSSGAD